MEPIRLYINYKVVEGPWGGANSFLRSLIQCFSAMPEIKVVTDERDDHDVLFLNQLSRGPGRKWWAGKFISPAAVARLKKYGARSSLQGTMNRLLASRDKLQDKKIVCRVVNLNEHAYGHKSNQDRQLLMALNYTDYDIFQSNYIREVFVRSGYNKKQSAVICNGVDQSVFNLNNKVWWDGQGPLRIFSCTFSSRKTKRFDIIARLSEEKEVECFHIGSWPHDVDPKKVQLLGKMTQVTFADLYRSQAHVFLHPAEKDVCPNGVIEALSSGLPVLYSTEGGTKEIVGNCGVAIGDDPLPSLDQIRSGYSKYVKQIREVWPTFSIGFAAGRYIQVFKQVVCM